MILFRLEELKTKEIFLKIFIKLGSVICWVQNYKFQVDHCRLCNGFGFIGFAIFQTLLGILDFEFFRFGKIPRVWVDLTHHYSKGPFC